MPRKKQPVQVDKSAVTYGEGKQLEEMQASMPLPQTRGVDDGMLHQQAVSAMESMPAPPPGGILGQPSTRPNEPLTAGMSIGPGPGPEATPMPNRQQHQFRQQLETAAAISGNPTLAKMAQNARRPIGRRLPQGKPR